MRRLLAIVSVLGTLCGHHAAAGPSPDEGIQEAKALQQVHDSLQGAWITPDDRAPEPKHPWHKVIGGKPWRWRTGQKKSPRRMW